MGPGRPGGCTGRPGPPGKRLAAWRSDPLLSKLTLSINVSAHQLRQPDFAPLALAPSRKRLTRGVVRWFDPQTRRGALRLQGVSGDLPFEPPLLERGNITRLFKGQEVEAEIGGTPEAPQLIDFRLLAAGPATHVNPGLVRARQQKPVMVELKREPLKRAAARDAAEALLPDRHD